MDRACCCPAPGPCMFAGGALANWYSDRAFLPYVKQGQQVSVPVVEQLPRESCDVSTCLLGLCSKR